MGGTTAKAALIEDGAISFVDEYEIGAGITVGSRLMKGDGYLLRIPAIDLAEVGAGGGSLAFVDVGGALQVGPRSVGADPGPACYGRGTTEATITDANVVLGYIGTERFAGGALRLDPALAWQALERLGRRMGMDAPAAAYAVHIVGNARMARAIRAVSTERGYDARDFTLLAFGGSGPIHAAQLARGLGIRRVVVPPFPGVFSALGLLCAPAGYQFVYTYLARLDRLGADELVAVVDDLTAQSLVELERLGYPADAVQVRVEADLRYVGQHFRVRVELPERNAAYPDGLIAAVRHRFEDEHERRYHHRSPQAPVELVGFHLAARVRASAPLLHLAGAAGNQVEQAREAAPSRPAYFSREERFVPARLLRREDLREPVRGPALVEEPDTTIVIPPGCEAVLDAQGNVVITVEE
jgi:N-methylhydantoinase A